LTIWLKEWQTLTAGILALLAAGVTVGVMMRQVHLQKIQTDKTRQESEDRRQRRLAACRAAMPADLSSILGYTHDCAHIIGTALKILRKEEERRELACPTLPERVIGNLQQLVEHIDREGANAIADLLSCYQVQYARLSAELGYFNSPHRVGRHRIMTEDNIEFTVEQTVLLFLLAESMFDFARRKAEKIPQRNFDETRVANALNVLELSDVVSSKYQDDLMNLLVGDKHNGDADNIGQHS